MTIEETITDLDLLMQEAKMGEGLVDAEGKVEIPIKDLPVTGIVRSGPGYETLYRVADGEVIPLPVDFVKDSLAKTDETGAPMFTRIKPDYSPQLGTDRCALHQDGPNREAYNAAGYPVCDKGTLRSPAQATMHMRRKHPSIWADLEAERLEKERLETLDLQRQVLRNQAGIATPSAAVPSVGAPEALAHQPASTTTAKTACGCGGSYKPKGYNFHVRGQAHIEWAESQGTPPEA